MHKVGEATFAFVLMGILLFSNLVVAYLFFGGAGAGALFLTAIIDAFAKQHSIMGGAGSLSAANSCDSVRRTKAFSLLAGEGLVAFGVICLAFDLGRLDRLALLFLAPSVSFISLGTFSLIVLLVSGALLCVQSFFDGLLQIRKAVFLIEIITVLSALFVMIYTGALLFSVGSAVQLWDSWWIPALFLFSSISCGCAIVLVVTVFVGEASFAYSFAKNIVRIDACIIVCEVLFAGFFVAGFMGEGDEAWWQPCVSLFAGDDVFFSWWIGFVLCGLVIPFLCEIAASKSFLLRFDGGLACVFVGILILFGGWCLRWSIVEAAQWKDMQLAYPHENESDNIIEFDSIRLD